MSENTYTFQPIGVFRSSQVYPYEAARQGAEDPTNSRGVIELFAGHNFQQGLEDLDQFSHLWIIFLFHHNPNWKPKVQPPRGSDHKVGVFASRSPHRPNPIGLSCVGLECVQGLEVHVQNHDILDGSPILDIKPYLPSADCFPKASMGWVRPQPYAVDFSPVADQQIKFLETLGVDQLRGFLVRQLTDKPLDHKKKRVVQTYDDGGRISYRTWRADFRIESNQITVQRIFSGYSQAEMNSDTDLYLDKKIHSSFRQAMGGERE